MTAMLAWIDTEFNSYKGELISLALVMADGREFYANLGCKEPDPWVALNVMPVLDAPVMYLAEAQIRLQVFLQRYRKVHVIADWPEDLSHFNSFLITGPGQRIDTPHLTMEIDRELNTTSARPHNALADARANKAGWIELYGPPRSEDLRA
jgi:hypothetical protein